LGLGITSKPRVLIIGGGDGGLQDFLRAITGIYSADRIYRGLPFKVQSVLEQGMLVRDVVEKRIYSAEDQAQRSYIWNSERHHDHYVSRRVHKSHDEIIDILFYDKRLWSEISRALFPMILFSADRDNIRLVHKCNHFRKGYGLNRFLVLLINRYLNQHGIFPLLSNREVTQIVGVKHTCGDPTVCHGKEHIVSFKESKCGTPDDDQENLDSLEDETYNIIVIRSGPRDFRYYFQGKPITNPRHLLPYYLPQ
jgi:hypothetical protein